MQYPGDEGMLKHPTAPSAATTAYQPDYASSPVPSNVLPYGVPAASTGHSPHVAMRSDVSPDTDEIVIHRLPPKTHKKKRSDEFISDLPDGRQVLSTEMPKILRWCPQVCCIVCLVLPTTGAFLIGGLALTSTMEKMIAFIIGGTFAVMLAVIPIVTTVIFCAIKEQLRFTFDHEKKVCEFLRYRPLMCLNACAKKRTLKYSDVNSICLIQTGSALVGGEHTAEFTAEVYSVAMHVGPNGEEQIILMTGEFDSGATPIVRRLKRLFKAERWTYD